jgi:glycosyltransferase involved in cell wall biosynthesis
MPKVLRIINRLNLGGPTHNVAYLTKYLDEKYETLLLSGTIDSTEESSEFLIKNLDITPRYIDAMQRELHPLKDYRAYKQIKKIIREYQPDIVHTHAAKAGAVGRLAAAHCKVPVILHTFHGHVFHSYFNPIKTKTFLAIERYLAKKSTCIIAISEIQKKELCEDYKIAACEKFTVIPLGFDLEKFNTDKEQKRVSFRKKWHIADDEIAIGIVGRMVPVKNHEMFLTAFAQLLKSTNKKVKAILIGDGECRTEIESKIQELHLTFSTEKNVQQEAPIVFCSWIKDVENAYPGLDIIALTSLNEGTPVSLIEAPAAGIPIVTTDVGGIKDIVLENETAYIVDSNDVDAFAEKLLLLTENDGLRKDIAAKGFSHVNQKFSSTRLAADMSNLYYKLFKQKV